MTRYHQALINKLMISSLAAVVTLGTTIARVDARAASGINSTNKAAGAQLFDSISSRLGENVLTVWQSQNDPQAILVVLHGFSLHKEAFEALAERMVKQNITVYGLDARGFGGWYNKGNSNKLNFRQSLDDLAELVRDIHGQYPEKPVFVLGESMGGAMALAYAAQRPGTIDGVIASVPAYKRVSGLGTSLAVAVDFIRHGGHSVELNHVMLNRASHNQELRQSWQSDPQARLKVSLADLIRFSSFMKQTKQNASQIANLPVLMVQGEQDKLIKPSGTEELFTALPTSQKELLALKGHEHLIFEDGQFDTSTFKVVSNWIAQHEGATQQLAASSTSAGSQRSIQSARAGGKESTTLLATIE